jgi:hypothetical protein
VGGLSRLLLIPQQGAQKKVFSLSRAAGHSAIPRNGLPGLINSTLFVVLSLVGCSPAYTHPSKIFTGADFENDYADCRRDTTFGSHSEIEKCLKERYGWTRVQE